jgi:zinc transport system permease protein
MPLDIFQYGFIVRGLIAGIIVSLIAPLIGIFLVLRRYSLIADTLAHVSLAGIAIGLLLGINPVITALGATIIASAGIERLRTSTRIYGESALALFLSGSLALAVVLISLADGFNANLFNFLFGSIVTVTRSDIYIITGVAILVVIVLFAFYKELVYITFDEEAARVSTIPFRFINTVLILLAALTVSLSIPIVGVLLISALIVVPTVTALQFRKNFLWTIIYAEIISVSSVIAGIFISYYLNLAAGGAIVLIMMIIFVVVFTSRRK